MELELDSVRAIVGHLAHLRSEYGEVLGDAELIEPNGDYFPDEFTRDADGVDAVLRRMLTYAPLSDELAIALGFVEPDEGAGGGGGCGSGACAPGAGEKLVARGNAIETEDGYAVILNVADAGDPTMMTTSLARSIGRIVLFEADEDIDPRDEAALSELTAVACGFGVLLLEGASVYKKGCGGMRQHRATHLSVEEVALALALFVRANEVKAGIVKRHLSVTQKEAFDAALDWVDGQPKLVARLRDQPETLADGVFEPEAPKGLLARLLSSKPKDGVDDTIAIRAKERASLRSDEEKRRIAEARKLVEEALQD